MPRSFAEMRDHVLLGTLERLDRMRPALENTRTPGTRAWLVQRLMVDLLATLLTGVVAAGLAYVFGRWTPVSSSAVWTGFAMAVVILAVLEARGIVKTWRQPVR